MGSFNFRLKRLLSFRNLEEDEAKRELGLRKVALEQETARLQRLKQEENEVLTLWRHQLEQQIELPRLQLTQEYSRVLENRMDNQAEQQRRSKDRLDEQREIARQCWRKKRMLEVLQEKAKLEHHHRLQVLEQNLIDEIVLNSYYRKGGDE